jgi:UPF0716 protein FxsA
MRPHYALLLVLAWPLAEIAGFVVVGRAIGLWWTLGLVIGTGLLGALLLRQQGLHLLKKLSQESQQGHVPASSVVDGAMIVIAGILLLLPGFLTDIVGIALFLPFVRRFLWSLIGQRVVVVNGGRAGFRRPSPSSGPSGSSSGSSSPERSSGAGKVLDLDEDEFRRDGNSNPSSPWAKDKDQEP